MTTYRLHCSIIADPPCDDAGRTMEAWSTYFHQEWTAAEALLRAKLFLWKHANIVHGLYRVDDGETCFAEAWHYLCTLYDEGSLIGEFTVYATSTMHLHFTERPTI